MACSPSVEGQGLLTAVSQGRLERLEAANCAELLLMSGSSLLQLNLALLGRRCQRSNETGLCLRGQGSRHGLATLLDQARILLARERLTMELVGGHGLANANVPDNNSKAAGGKWPKQARMLNNSQPKRIAIRGRTQNRSSMCWLGCLAWRWSRILCIVKAAGC